MVSVIIAVRLCLLTSLEPTAVIINLEPAAAITGLQQIVLPVITPAALMHPADPEDLMEPVTL